MTLVGAPAGTGGRDTHTAERHMHTSHHSPGPAGPVPENPDRLLPAPTHPPSHPPHPASAWWSAPRPPRPPPRPRHPCAAGRWAAGGLGFLGFRAPAAGGQQAAAAAAPVRLVLLPRPVHGSALLLPPLASVGCLAVAASPSTHPSHAFAPPRPSADTKGQPCHPGPDGPAHLSAPPPTTTTHTNHTCAAAGTHPLPCWAGELLPAPAAGRHASPSSQTPHPKPNPRHLRPAPPRPASQPARRLTPPLQPAPPPPAASASPAAPASRGWTAAAARGAPIRGQQRQRRCATTGGPARGGGGKEAWCEGWVGGERCGRTMWGRDQAARHKGDLQKHADQA